MKFIVTRRKMRLLLIEAMSKGKFDGYIKGYQDGVDDTRAQQNGEYPYPTLYPRRPR